MPTYEFSDALVEWIERGERGLSSNAIVRQLTGFPMERRWHDASAYPLDPSDLRRCRLLLEQVPELAPRIGEMAAVSLRWAGLVAAWSDLCRLMDEEAPNWREGYGPCPKTYAAMRVAIARAA